MLSGYDHGVADAKDPCKPDCRKVYIWHSPNGFINQTKEFIDGYVLGFCRIAGLNSSIDEPEADFDCTDGPESAGWMIGSTITGTYTKFTTSPPSYWTASNATVSKDFKKYHLFMDGVNSWWNQTDDASKRITILGNDGLTLCLDYNASYNSSGPTLCHTITNIPSTYNSTINAGYFVVPSYMNESMGYIMAKVKYQNVGVGPAHGLNGTTWRMDMDEMYDEISSVMACVEHYHFKMGTSQFHDCYEGVS